MNRKEYAAEWRKKNKKRIAKAKAEWYQKNKKRIAKERKAYQEANKDKIKLRSAKYYQANKESIKKRVSEYYQNNKEQASKKNKAWRIKNAEYIKEYRNRPDVKARHKHLTKVWKDNNKEHLLAYNKKRWADNKEELSKVNKQWMKDNAEYRKKWKIQYQKDNQDKIKSYRKQYYPSYYLKNKETIIKNGKEWAKNNRDSVRKNQRDYMRRELKKYPLFYRIKGNINSALKAYSIVKAKSIKRYGIFIDKIVKHLTKEAKALGYTYKDIKDYFHIDHIIPISYYNLNNEKDIAKCWNCLNLRWLPVKENISRGNKLRPKDIEVIKKLPKEIYPKSWKGKIPKETSND